MKIAHLIITVALVAISASVLAAPVESVESARATAAWQKVQAFLGEKAVVAQMTKLGVSPAQAQARVARLNDAQVEQLAAQIDLLKSGGTIERGYCNRLGPLSCIWRQCCETVTHIMKFLFCWTDV
jgi:hypothetical protein